MRAQRVAARGELGVLHAAGRTRIDRLYQEGAAKIRMPRTVGDPLEAVLINTAGGLTGGDRLDWSIHVGDGASATVTTQTCEKVYRAASDIAKVGCRMSVGDGGRLAWLPQETIVFDNSAFRRTIEIDLASDAEALVVEATVFGRRAMGESVGAGVLRGPLACQARGPAGPCRGFRDRSRCQPAACRAARARWRNLRGDAACPDRRMRSSGSTRCAPSSATLAARQRLDGRRIWQASCEAHRRRQLRSCASG